MSVFDCYDHDPPDAHVTRREFKHALRQIRRLLMANQADIDAITQGLGQVETDLQTTQQTLQAEIDQLAQANPSLDLSGLQAAVAPLDAQVQALGQLKPTPPAPAA